MNLLRYLAFVLVFTALFSPGNALCEDIDFGEISVTDIPRLVEEVASGGKDWYHAAEVLATFGDDASRPLIDALETGRNKYGILTALGLLKHKDGMAPLAKYLCGDDAYLADPAAAALRNYGDAAIETLAGALKAQGCFERALDVMGYTASPSRSSLELVRGLVSSPDPHERAGAGALLGWWGDTESGPALEALLKDPDPMVREWTISGYGRLFGDAADLDQELLITLLKDENPAVRAAAAELLGRTPSDEVTTALIEVIKNDKDQLVRRMAVVGLESSKDPRIAFALTGILQEEKPDEMLLAQALYQLGVLEAKESVPYIVGMFEKGHVDSYFIQQEAFEALGLIGEPVDLKMFLPYLKVGVGPHKDSTVQILFMFEKLGSPSDKEVIEALEKFRDGMDHPMKKDMVQKTIDAMKEK